MAAESGLALERRLLELNRAAKEALKAGDVSKAVATLEEAIRLEPASPALRLNLAAAYRLNGEEAAALGAVDGALKLDPRDFASLLMKGSVLEAMGRRTEAARTFGAALLFRPKASLDGPTEAALDHAVAVHAQYRNDLAAAIDKAVSSELSEVLASGMPSNVARFVAAATGRSKVFTPSPTQQHFPGLPYQEFYDRSLLPWLSGLEARTSEIRAELDAALSGRSELLEPYVNADESLPLDQWAELNRSNRWTALHVIRHGRLSAFAEELFPATLEALRSVPQPVVANRSPNAMFSALRPRTRIPPHTGVSNARLVLHLPLIVPDDCGFRVGGETRTWRVGEAWVFDDTIEHEAWNDSEELRVVLIADLWNVFMTEVEKRAYIAAMHATDALEGAASEAAH